MRTLPGSLVFGRDEARGYGWTNASLSRAAASGRLQRAGRGLYALPGVDADLAQAVAAARSVSGSVVSHRSALLAHGLPLVGARPRLPEITVPPRGTGDAACALLHRASLPAVDLAVLHGVPTTTVARTLIDVARRRPAVTAVPAIDAALNRRLVTVAELDEVLQRCGNWPGARLARRALMLVDGRAESPLESVSRLVIGWLHLPPPDLQARVVDERGIVIARLDFSWDEFGVGGEADGRSKYDDRHVLTAEKERQEAVEDLHLPIARWGWELAWRQPRQLGAKIEGAFARGRARDRAGLPRGWSIWPTEPVR